MKRRKVAFLGLRGNKRFPRFIITEEGGEVWTGEGWSKDQGKAILFACPGVASRASQKVMRQQFSDLGCVERFNVPIHVEVRSQQGIDPEELREWLVRAADFRVAYGTFGTGPTEESLVLCNASFFELRAAEREAEPRGQDGGDEES